MAKDKYTADEMIAALQETKGMITLAARKLGCSVHTVQRYIELYPTVKAAKQTEHEKLGDNVELALYEEAIKKRNITALIFLAKTQFKERGYVESLNINIILVNKLVSLLQLKGHDPSEVFNDMVAALMNERVNSD